MDDFNRIIKLENEIDLIKRKLKQNEIEKTNLKSKLEDYIKELDTMKFNYDDLHAGSKLKFKDEDDNIYEFIKAGYINALEYQRPNVQGMIINSLKKINKNVASIIGSDCHQWEYYPQKDAKNGYKGYVSKIRALPTFDGLVFSFTSMDTRFNRLKNSNANYIEKIKITLNIPSLTTMMKLYMLLSSSLNLSFEPACKSS